MTETWLSRPLQALFDTLPETESYCLQLGLCLKDRGQTLAQIVERLSEEECEDRGFDRAGLEEHLEQFLARMGGRRNASRALRTLTVTPGRDKSGRPETAGLTLVPGDVVSIVGPTGSGKSRLLADIECLAQGDTPTGRRVLVNGVPPAPEARFSAEHKLVAQLSQNMNFVMDLTVGEFIAMHAESRLIADPRDLVRKIIGQANDLAGEPFGLETSLTQLSGGQSRALMIADTALLSPLPVVLIDEIENAGVDRKKALALLVREEKMVLMSTHDPLLALLGDKRLVIKNGGVNAVLWTSAQERANLAVLEKIDARLTGLRQRLRTGSAIDFDLRPYFADSGEKVAG